MAFLYTSQDESRKDGLSQLDVILISGDAYVDHPSFAAAMIGKALEAEGFSVGVIAQPDWKTADDFRRLGEPRLFFGVAPGNVDSMLAHYTVARKLRRDDAYSPGGRAGCRPNRAAIVYANRLRQAFPNAPVVLGGIEASLRRQAHYDYWQNKVRRSILLDARADLLVYGMGEAQIIEIARRCAQGEALQAMRDIRGTAFECRADEYEPQDEAVRLPSHEQCAADAEQFAEAFRLTYREQNPHTGRTLIQPHANRLVVVNPPALPLSSQELDRLYELPFERRWHPIYDDAGGVPALETVRFSITSHRGCYGDCSFCALAFHQGRIIQSRSKESILREVEELKKLPEWRGIISDIGGPTANMYRTGCSKKFRCKSGRCLGNKVCPNLNTDAEPLVDLLRAVRAVPGVRKVFTGSGVRFDLCLEEKQDRYLRELCEHHVSGQLRIAPEHVSRRVLDVMGKPGPEVFERFRQKFNTINGELGKEQYLVFYFMSSHPGCGIREMRELADYLEQNRLRAEQVQDFYPCPMTLSSCIYHTGINPLTGERVYVAKTDKDKLRQRHLLNTPEKKRPPRKGGGRKQRSFGRTRRGRNK